MDPVSSGADVTTPKQVFPTEGDNATYATGGDSRLYDLNVFYDVSRIACQLYRNRKAHMFCSLVTSLS